MPDRNVNLEIQFHFKDMDSSEAIKNYAIDKSERVKKFIQKNGSVKWSFEVDNKDHHASCHLVTESWNDFCDAVSPDMYKTINLVIDKLIHLVQKQKEKLKSHH